jgi:uncharacterized membrane protein
MILENVVLVVAGTLTALVAGLFFGFEVSVNRGLHRLKDPEYVGAMQSINVAILNPIFMLSFFGPVILLPLAAFLYRDSSVALSLLASGSLLYIIGTFGLTMAGNVPLNERLARFDPSNASDDEVARARKQFEGRWNRLHSLRTVASVAATVVVFTACVSV